TVLSRNVSRARADRENDSQLDSQGVEHRRTRAVEKVDGHSKSRTIYYSADAGGGASSTFHVGNTGSNPVGDANEIGRWVVLILTVRICQLCGFTFIDEGSCFSRLGLNCGDYDTYCVIM